MFIITVVFVSIRSKNEILLCAKYLLSIKLITNNACLHIVFCATDIKYGHKVFQFLDFELQTDWLVLNLSNFPSATVTSKQFEQARCLTMFVDSLSKYLFILKFSSFTNSNRADHLILDNKFCPQISSYHERENIANDKIIRLFV